MATEGRGPSGRPVPGWARGRSTGLPCHGHRRGLSTPVLALTPGLVLDPRLGHPTRRYSGPMNVVSHRCVRDGTVETCTDTVDSLRCPTTSLPQKSTYPIPTRDGATPCKEVKGVRMGIYTVPDLLPPTVTCVGTWSE